MKDKISVVIIARNEESEIAACLESVAWADEIVLVDSGSTDRTVEIARGFTERVESHPFEGFTAQKQHATDLAAGPWILNVDADERVTPKLRREIEMIIESPDASDGYTLPRLTSYAGAFVRHAWYPDRKLRLFRKSKGRWAGGAVHEGMRVDGTVGELQSPLLHYSFRTISDHLRTIDRLTDYGAEDLARLGRGGSFWNLVIRPPSTFIKMYFIRKGMFDGWRGLVIALLSAAHTMVKYAKARQLLEANAREERKPRE